MAALEMVRKIKPAALVVSLMFLFSASLAGAALAGDGTIRVATEPAGAKVTVDTDQEGITPCELEVPEGERKLKIKLRAFITAHETVEVQPGEAVEVNLKLVPIPTT